jgi:hypothetical protein
MKERNEICGENWLRKNGIFYLKILNFNDALFNYFSLIPLPR